MAYRIKLSPQAANDLSALDKELGRFVAEHLIELQESPVTLSRPSEPPVEPPGYQAYPFAVTTSEQVRRFVVLFRYAANEFHLLVYRIMLIPTA